MADPAGRGAESEGARTYQEIMTVPPPPASTPFEAAELEYVFGKVWNRPGLSRRDRRWISLTCAGAADTVGPIRAHVYASLNGGDMSLLEMQEFVLHFAVYCGWPKASFLNQVVTDQWARICSERGVRPEEQGDLPVWSAGMDPSARMAGGEAWFSYINCVRYPPANTPYTAAGILNYVFGEVWQRPGLTDRDRRFITVAAVGLDDTDIPIRSHVYAALKSGDITLEEMYELVLHFAVHSGWPKASFLNQVTSDSWTRIDDEGGVRPPMSAPPRGLV
jgi:4-carboxymuconolactone decarboxylase